MYSGNQIISKFKFSKKEIWKFLKLNSFISKIEICTRRSQKWPAAKLLHSDGNPISIITWCSYSAKIKLQYIKNTFHVENFHIRSILSTRKYAKRPKFQKNAVPFHILIFNFYVGDFRFHIPGFIYHMSIFILRIFRIF